MCGRRGRRAVEGGDGGSAEKVEGGMMEEFFRA